MRARESWKGREVSRVKKSKGTSKYINAYIYMEGLSIGRDPPLAA